MIVFVAGVIAGAVMTGLAVLIAWKWAGAIEGMEEEYGVQEKRSH